MRVFVDTQILQIFFAGSREVDFVEDFTARIPIVDERQHEAYESERTP